MSTVYWHERTVAIRRAGMTGDDPRLDIVEGYTSSAAPGLAITPTMRSDVILGGWSITHCYSGHSIPRVSFETLDEAQAFALRLAQFGDWTRSETAIKIDRDFATRARLLIAERNSTRAHSTPQGAVTK